MPIVAALVIGFLAGAVAAGAAVYFLMPRMMIVTERSPLDVPETVAKLSESLQQEGWSSPNTINMGDAMAKKGVDFDREAMVLELCKADYAQRVLEERTDMTAMMPCRIGVWEGKDGATYVSKLNTGLMGKMFGGVVGEVMGGRVAREEDAILKAALQ